MSFQIQVRGEWAGAVGGWRPAVAGTVNQTGLSDEEASTCATHDEAQATLDRAILPLLDSDPDDGAPRRNAPEFRIREVP